MERKTQFQIMTLNKSFEACSVDNGDELFRNGIFVFNITKMMDFIRKNIKDFVLESIDVKSYQSHFNKLDESTVETADPFIPIILAEIRPGMYNVIDGNHRLEKAFVLGLTNINAYKVTSSQHVRFLISKKSYISYVEYWNRSLDLESLG